MNQSSARSKQKAKSDLAREVGQAIKDAREAADLSQAELAKKLKTRNGTPLERSKVSSYERGEYIPEPRMRPLLARALKVSEVELFGSLASGPERDSVFNRLERVERRLASVERILKGQGVDLQLGSDGEDAEAAARAAKEADLRDQESAKPARRSPRKRPSKGRRG